MYRSVLVQIDVSQSTEARITAAARIAEVNGATLSAVLLKSDYVAPAGHLSAVAAADTLFAEQRRKADEVGPSVRVIFDRIVHDTGIEATWTELSGEFEDDLISHLRLHDLAVVPRYTNVLGSDHSISAARIGLSCGGPVLVLPDGAYPTTFGRKIILAWKDSREAARVLRDAWPFLRAADEIHVVTAAREGSRQSEELLQRHLQLHGCKPARFTMERDTDRPAGELIRQHIDILGADMVVLGLFGHSRFRELVVGGVSQHLLNYSSVPLLVSH